MKKYLVVLLLVGILTACGSKKEPEVKTGTGLEEFYIL